MTEKEFTLLHSALQEMELNLKNGIISKMDDRDYDTADLDHMIYGIQKVAELLDVFDSDPEGIMEREIEDLSYLAITWVAHDLFGDIADADASMKFLENFSDGSDDVQLVSEKLIKIAKERK